MFLMIQRMIGIRVDANEQIASGHVMRCMSVADALFSLGADVIFFTADEYCREMVLKRGHKAVCLYSDWNDKDGELEQITAELGKYHIDVLLVDSYQVTVNYLSNLRNVVKVAYLDDMNAFDYPVDIVINYSIYAEELNYPGNKEYILGMDYVPLRKQFDISDDRLTQSISFRKLNKQILVMTGASDPYHMADKVIRGILDASELNDYGIVVIKGKFWDGSFTLDDDFSDRIRILENVENMSDVMLGCSLAVSAGGSTLYELCACCVPTVTVSCADNQLGNVNGFAKRGIMEYAGDAWDDDIGTRVSRLLVQYHLDNDRMRSIREKMRGIGCGKGAERLARKLCGYV